MLKEGIPEDTPFSKKLTFRDAELPKPWKGKLLRYQSMEDSLNTWSSAESAQKVETEQEFFGKFFREIEKVNTQFRQLAKSVIGAYRRRPWWKAFTKSKTFTLSAGSDGIEVTPEELSLHAKICLEYAKINAEGLKRIADEHDARCGNESGKIIYESMWRNQSGMAEFLHSPLLTELEAVSQLHQCGEECGETCGNQASSETTTETNECANLEQNLSCPICLDILYKPVALGCGHKFCAQCLFKSLLPAHIGSVTALLSAVPPKERCPECRQRGVFKNATAMSVLDEVIKTKFPKYWEERRCEEKAEERQLKARYMKQLEERYGAFGVTHPSVILYG